MFKVPEKDRVVNGVIKSGPADGNFGQFRIWLSNRTVANCIVTDGMGWEHVSVHIVSDRKKRTPTWAEMCKIKDLFWDEEDCVVQYHPAKKDYVNNHEHCLHIWRQVGVEYAAPPPILVGVLS